MRMVLALAGACGLLAAVSVSDAVAKGPGGPHGNMMGPHGNAGGLTRGLNRADMVAGPHGLRGRNIARTRGANALGFCPPGQSRKPGLGSRFRC